MKYWWYAGTFATMFYMIYAFADVMAGAQLLEIFTNVIPASVAFFMFCLLIFHLYDERKKKRNVN